MKITEKQLHALVRVLEGSLVIMDKGDIFGCDRATRIRLHNDIRAQQSDKLINVED